MVKESSLTVGAGVGKLVALVGISLKSTTLVVKSKGSDWGGAVNVTSSSCRPTRWSGGELAAVAAAPVHDTATRNAGSLIVMVMLVVMLVELCVGWILNRETVFAPAAHCIKYS